VCDIENIRKIFAHKYGGEVDFSGYIDKFYSTEVFYLFHKNIFNEQISPYLEQKIRIRSQDGSQLNISPLFILAMKLLFDGKELNIRMLKRIGAYKPSFISNNEILDHQLVLFSRFGAKEDSVLKTYPLLIVVKILLELFSSKEELLRKLKNALLNYLENDDVYQSHYYKQFFKDAILFADIENHRFHLSTNENTKEMTYAQSNTLYKVLGNHYNRTWNEGEMEFWVDLSQSEKTITNGMFYPVLVDAVEVILEKGIVS
jgi:hypothetical protein